MRAVWTSKCAAWSHSLTLSLSRPFLWLSKALFPKLPFEASLNTWKFPIEWRTAVRVSPVHKKYSNKGQSQKKFFLFQNNQTSISTAEQSLQSAAVVVVSWFSLHTNLMERVIYYNHKRDTKREARGELCLCDSLVEQNLIDLSGF